MSHPHGQPPVRYSAQEYNKMKMRAGGVDVKYNWSQDDIHAEAAKRERDLYQHPYAVQGQPDRHDPSYPHYSQKALESEKRLHVSPIRNVHDREGAPVPPETPDDDESFAIHRNDDSEDGLDGDGCGRSPHRSQRALQSQIACHRTPLDAHRRVEAAPAARTPAGGAMSHTELRKRIAQHEADVGSPPRGAGGHAGAASPDLRRGNVAYHSPEGNPTRSSGFVSHRIMAENKQRCAARPFTQTNNTVLL